jgi:ABC-type transport system involved in multi-copper enzyme maturation permease subunit
LQIIPLLGFFLAKKETNFSIAKVYLYLFSILYFGWLCFILMQAIDGQPFIHNT